MKLRSAIRTLSLAGVATTVMIPGMVAAAPSFGGWSAAGGTISGCPSGATCAVLVSEDGFLQQEVSLSGQTFFQTIVTDSGVSGNDTNLDFATETFVEQAPGGTADGGVMSRLTVNDVDGGGNGLTSQADLQTGNFASTGAGIAITQAVVDGGGSSGTTDDFETTMLLNRDLDSDGNDLGTDLQLSQNVGLDLTGLQTPGSHDTTAFVLRRVSDAPGAGSVTLPAGQGSTTTFGGTLDWTAGADVVVTWVGQRINIDPTLGDQLAAYQAVQNFGPGGTTGVIDTFDFGAVDVGPWDWGSGSSLENTFGSAPEL